ncbi:hypothetical protein HOS70_gp15 [Erwinia phage vB_EamP-S2]|uniref:Uncharacterized protein n=1 Tax=Erwinia phage vB_EamP-S2 TaxID=2070198 RepID=A0A2K9V4X1_9CAUD|nr:hypothetical protein HOS70_gp15 [Erwinia phage vB_EamP-S2]AUV57214.1 hypothetical protein [Erwinia phage vB_EamP-S2]UNA00873.1 hypothetical protein VLVyarbaL_00035 [Erwinia phage VyarbaL]
MKIIKKFEVEVVEAHNLVIVSVYPKPRCSITEPSYRQPVDAITYRRMSDEDRARYVGACVNSGVQQLMEVKSEDA